MTAAEQKCSAAAIDDDRCGVEALLRLASCWELGIGVVLADRRRSIEVENEV